MSQCQTQNHFILMSSTVAFIQTRAPCHLTRLIPLLPSLVSIGHAYLVMKLWLIRLISCVPNLRPVPTSLLLPRWLGRPKFAQLLVLLWSTITKSSGRPPSAIGSIYAPWVWHTLSASCDHVSTSCVPSTSSSNCTQIPKLRIACASSGNGQRTMWSHCEQCGAISMVDSD